MEPAIHILDSAIRIHQFFRGYRCHPPTGWWFRGQADASWTLVPKAGRPQFVLKDGKCLGRFRRWSREAVAYHPDLPPNDWERLAVAQHHGLATCLLDWTFNPLVAVYFACSELPEVDGMVYCYMPTYFVDVDVLDLWSCDLTGYGFIPRAISPRILNQKGVFTVHLPANRAIEVGRCEFLENHPTLAGLKIPSALKKELLVMLDDYGINQATLFPDLGGLSHHVNWETSRISKGQT